MCWGKCPIFGIKSLKWLKIGLIWISVVGWRIEGPFVEIFNIWSFFKEIILFRGYWLHPFQYYGCCVPGTHIERICLSLSLLNGQMGRRLSNINTDVGDLSADSRYILCLFPSGAHTKSIHHTIFETIPVLQGKGV